MQRLDKLLVEHGLATTRTQAQKLIEAGLVEAKVAGQWGVQKKPSVKLLETCELRTGEHPDMRYVSRAGLKLEAALRDNSLDVAGLTALDVGQSTGGFTDCLLKHGASKVVGVEVGHDQLVAALREHADVVCLEGLNARHLDPDILKYAPDKFDIAVMDVSFISQKLILPRLPDLLKPQGLLVTLIKPQFEVGPEGLGKGGLVKPNVDMQALECEFKAFVEALSFNVLHYSESPIKGGDGNHEFLLVARFAA